MKKRLLSRRGETLVEGMMSLLVLSLVAMALCTAVVTASRINAQAKEQSAHYAYEKSSVTATKNITLTWGEGDEEKTQKVKVDYSTATNGVGETYYYETYETPSEP